MLIRLSLIITILLLFSLANGKQALDPSFSSSLLDSKFNKVRLNDKNFAKIRNMHLNWYIISIKALMGQLGKELYEKLDSVERRLLLRCLDKIDDRKDLVLSARCLVLARKRYNPTRYNKSVQEKANKNDWLGGFRVRDEYENVEVKSDANTNRWTDDKRNTRTKKANNTIELINSKNLVDLANATKFTGGFNKAIKINKFDKAIKKFNKTLKILPSNNFDNRIDSEASIVIKNPMAKAYFSSYRQLLAKHRKHIRHLTYTQYQKQGPQRHNLADKTRRPNDGLNVASNASKTTARQPTFGNKSCGETVEPLQQQPSPPKEENETSDDSALKTSTVASNLRDDSLKKKLIHLAIKKINTWTKAVGSLQKACNSTQTYLAPFVDDSSTGKYITDSNGSSRSDRLSREYDTQRIYVARPFENTNADTYQNFPNAFGLHNRPVQTRSSNISPKLIAPRFNFQRRMIAKRHKRSLSWFRQKESNTNRIATRTEMEGINDDPWKVELTSKTVNQILQITKANHTSLTSFEDKSPVSRITNLISMFVRTPTQNETEMRSAQERQNRWSHTYNQLLRMKREIEKKKDSPGARAYDLRMYDLVLGSDKPTQSPAQSRTTKGLVEMAMDLFAHVSGDQHHAQRVRSNSKFLSPRFAPLMPDKVEADKSELSPTILAFYDESANSDTGNATTSTNNIASIPQILKATGMNKKDSDTVMGMIMDVSGARDTIEDALAMLNELNFFGTNSEIMGATEKLVAIYDKLEKSMKPKQTQSLNSRGFTFLDMDQINKVYRDPVLNVPDVAMDFKHYARLRPNQREESLWKTIERIAINQPEESVAKNQTENKWAKRAKDADASVLVPTVLAPFAFSPVFGLIVLGPTVLSPSLFSPLILNPSVLSPFVLSPAVGIPFIISPYVLSPYVLSPLVFAPFILNPYVLSPNVLNPYVLSPLILSPLVLCPDVVSPMVLGGAILSPSVASPAVLTETFLMANVLSPSFLS